MIDAILFLGPIGAPELIMLLIVILLLGAPLLVVFLVLFFMKKSSPPSGTLPPAIPMRSVEERLILLDGLKNSQRISETEYETKRKQLLQEL